MILSSPLYRPISALPLFPVYLYVLLSLKRGKEGALLKGYLAALCNPDIKLSPFVTEGFESAARDTSLKNVLSSCVSFL
jgi:hypothetical protein